jgi:K+-sensing histidine kinase KdpD
MNDAPSIDLDLSRIAHDLRGPLMPLRTAAWLLRNEQGGAARIAELGDIVDRQSVRLARMLDELSDWGSVGEARAALRREPVEVSLAVDMAIGGIPGCELTPELTDDAAVFPLEADPHGFGQVLRTLIEHAVHRAPALPPDIALCVAAGQLHIRVRDHGEPLDAASRESLLTRPQVRPFDEGLGLRFLLARKIVEAHGGRLVIDDAVHDGLGLICVLPVSESDDRARPSDGARAG